MTDPAAGDPQLLAGRYRLAGLLGRGGMAEVYDGFDERLARPVAVKILRPTAADDAGMRQRFEREARSVARLSHPAVVAVYDSGEDRGRAYLVMERLPGETLADRMRQGQLDPVWLAPIAADVLGALGAAHALGLVHRDIKPANILITREGRAKVADFGIAKTYRDDLDPTGPGGADLTATGLILGTVAYLSPEQIDGAAASPQADVYAVGVVLYEALAGRKPFVGVNPIAQARAATEGRVADLAEIRPDVDRRFVAVVQRAMARRVEDRYPTAAAMLADLVASGLVDGPVAGPRPGPDETVLLPGSADTVLLPVAAGTVAVPAAGAPGPTRPTRRAVGAPEPPPAVPRSRRSALVAAVAVLAVVVVVAAVVAVLVDRHDTPRTITPTTLGTRATTPSSATSAVPSTTTPTTAAPSTTTPTTAAPSTTTATTAAPSTTTASTTTPTTAAPSTTTATSAATTTPATSAATAGTGG